MEIGNIVTQQSEAISAGNFSENSEKWNVVSERDNVAVDVAGVDIWQGSAKQIPEPSASGEQMTIVSTHNQDTDLGNGARRVTIEYLDTDGLEQKEIFVMDGQNEVDTVATDITFVM